jgi:hypothetical protein
VSRGIEWLGQKLITESLGFTYIYLKIQRNCGTRLRNSLARRAARMNNSFVFYATFLDTVDKLNAAG